MRNYFLLISLALFISCNNEDVIFEVGKQFIETDLDVIEIDTLNINVSTIISDSLVTSNPTRILVGSIKDDEFGDLKARSYFALSNSTYAIDDAAVFDSIALIMHYDRYYSGDTTQVQTYKVHEIIEKFEPLEDDVNFYNTSTLETSDEVIGEVTFTPYPNKKDSINITMDYNFGYQIFEKIKDGEITELEEFYREFRGVLVSSEGNADNVIGFKCSSTSSDTTMRVYYTLKEEDNSENDQYSMDFNLTGGTMLFNSIISDKSPTPLHKISSGEEKLLTSETSNKAYLQSGTGVNMRIDFPTLRNLNDIENNSTILESTLKFYPDLNSYNNELIDSLKVFIIDNKNRTINQLSTYSGDVAYAKLNSIQDEFEEDVYYEVDVSFFVESILTDIYDLDYSLRIEFPNNASTINRLLFYDEESPENSDCRMKLNITYLNY